jgi:hypothetical protein
MRLLKAFGLMLLAALVLIAMFVFAFWPMPIVICYELSPVYLFGWWVLVFVVGVTWLMYHEVGE